MRHRMQVALLSSFLLTTGCEKPEVVTKTPEATPQLTLQGSKVNVALNRSALGLSTDRPLSRQTGSYNGVEVSISGYVIEDNDRYLVLSRLPDPREHTATGLTWVPRSSILSIYQGNHDPTSQAEAENAVETWRLDAMQNILGMVSYPLRDLPQGKLTLWWTKNGKKEFLDEISTVPGFDQWVCVGVAPVNNDSLFLSVVSEEHRGFNLIALPSPDLTPLHSTLKSDHDWTQSAVIAEEGSGDGKLWAQLKPAR